MNRRTLSIVLSYLMAATCGAALTSVLLLATMVTQQVPASSAHAGSSAAIECWKQVGELESAPAESGTAVVHVTGRRMTAAEKAEFDAQPQS